MSFPAYPDYKHSGVELLAEYPSHWVLKRFKNVFEERAERSSDGSEELLSVSAYFGVKPRSETLDEGDHLSRAESLEGYKVCRAGDLVINIMLAWNRGLGFSWQHGIVSPAYSVFHVTDGSFPKFLDYLVRSDECIRYFKTHSAGIMDSRLRLYPESFGRLFSVIPPAGEQAQIARFLDHETARIDALIEEQQRLIELLKEKRQSVISHAVTKGLDPTVPMKNSGFEWLGEVPAHWVVAGLKWFWSVTDCKHITAEFVDDGVPLASIREVQCRYVTLENAKQTTEVFYRQLIEAGRKPVAGDLIFSRNATVGEVAQVADWHPPFAMGQDVCLLKKQFEWLSSDYLQAVLRSPVVTVQLDNLMIGSTFKRVNVEDIRGLVVPMPPEDEQQLIAEYVNSETGIFDSLLSECQGTIGLLQERRSVLISAAVTGKIDVRGWQPSDSTQVPKLAVAEVV
jgi:type I restriction enzyme S subunit